MNTNKLTSYLDERIKARKEGKKIKSLTLKGAQEKFGDKKKESYKGQAAEMKRDYMEMHANNRLHKKTLERNKSSAIKKTLGKAKGESMVGKLKRLMKEPNDHYKNFKKQHNIK